MFWGLIMEPQRRYTQKVKKAFHVSMAALDASTSGTEPAQVMCSLEGRNYLLCTLKKPDMVQCPLDLNFAVGTEVSFAANGKSHVHLTGYLTDEFPMDFDEEEAEEEEEEDDEVEEEEEEVEVVSKKEQKKRNKAQPLVNGQQKKKLKLEELEEEEDSSDEDYVATQLEDVDEEEDDDESSMDDEDQVNEVIEGEEDSDDEEAEEEEEVVESKKKPKMNGLPEKQKKKKKDQEEEDGKQQKQKNNKQPQQQQQSKPQKKALQGGVIIEELKEGQGAPAKNGRFVSVYYEGRLKNSNKLFDSATKGNGFRFRLGAGEVIKGWDIGVAGMKVGGKRRIICPPQMAYGHKGSPPAIPPNSTLVFDVEMKKIS